MKHKEFKAPLIWLAAVLLLAFASATYSQASDVQNQPPPAQIQNAPAQAAPAQNLPTELNFTPQQVQQWREINREFRNQEKDDQDNYPGDYEDCGKAHLGLVSSEQ